MAVTVLAKRQLHFYLKNLKITRYLSHFFLVNRFQLAHHCYCHSLVPLLDILEACMSCDIVCESRSGLFVPKHDLKQGPD